MESFSGDGAYRNEQKEHWERFYQEHQRPWRGVGKLGGFDPEKGSKVLDIGCGNGKTVVALIQMGMIVTGLDFSVSAVDRCRTAFGDKATFVVAECDDMPFPDRSFDAVTAIHVLEHLNDEQLVGTVDEIRRILVPGGKVFVRSFAVGDMRSGGRDSNIRGNGIAYRYHTTEMMCKIFDGFEMVSSERIDESTRFGAVRVKMECQFALPEKGI